MSLQQIVADAIRKHSIPQSQTASFRAIAGAINAATGGTADGYRRVKNVLTGNPDLDAEALTPLIEKALSEAPEASVFPAPTPAPVTRQEPTVANLSDAIRHLAQTSADAPEALSDEIDRVVRTFGLDGDSGT